MTETPSATMEEKTMKPTREEIQDALIDKAYIDGARAGYNIGVLEESIAGHNNVPYNYAGFTGAHTKIPEPPARLAQIINARKDCYRILNAAREHAEPPRD